MSERETRGRGIKISFSSSSLLSIYFTRMARKLIEANVKASPWDNGSKEPCPRTQRSGHGRIRTEDRLIRSPTP